MRQFFTPCHEVFSTKKMPGIDPRQWQNFYSLKWPMILFFSKLFYSSSSKERPTVNKYNTFPIANVAGTLSGTLC